MLGLRPQRSGVKDVRCRVNEATLIRFWLPSALTSSWWTTTPWRCDTFDLRLHLVCRCHVALLVFCFATFSSGRLLLALDLLGWKNENKMKLKQDFVGPETWWSSPRRQRPRWWRSYSGIGEMNLKNIRGTVCWGTGIMRGRHNGPWEEQPLLICVPFTRNIKVVRFGPHRHFFLFNYFFTDSEVMELKSHKNKKGYIFSLLLLATADNVGAFCAQHCACWVIFSGCSLITSVCPH